MFGTAAAPATSAFGAPVAANPFGTTAAAQPSIFGAAAAPAAAAPAFGGLFGGGGGLFGQAAKPAVAAPFAAATGSMFGEQIDALDSCSFFSLWGLCLSLRRSSHEA